MNISAAYGGVFSFLLILAVGIYFRRTGFITQDRGIFLSQLVTKVAAPCLLISSTIQYMPRELFTSKPTVLFVVPLIALVPSFLIAWLLVKLFMVKEKTGIYYAMFIHSNTGSVGLPVCLAVLGEHSVPCAIVSFACNTIAFWTIGVFFISKDSDRPIRLGRDILRNFLTPPIIALAIITCLFLPKKEIRP